MPLFHNKNGRLVSIKEDPFKKEKELQSLTEQNLKAIFGLEFVATEYQVENLFIDTLAYDEESNSFVIIEYKRDRSFSVVDQGFSYLSLMLNHKADFILAYNEACNKSIGKDDIDWSQVRIIFVARSFTAHQQNAVNFRNMPFELWEVAQFESKMIQYRKIETSKSAESLTQMREVVGETSKVTKEVKTYLETDLLGTEGKSYDLYVALKERLQQVDPNLVPNPKKIYIGFQVPDNWRIIFKVQKIRDGVEIHFTRSKPKDFDDPKKKLVYIKNSVRYYNQNVTTLPVTNESDVSYAILMIQQACDRFVKEFGS